MGIDKLTEPVAVGVIYTPPSGFRPAWFIWNGRKIRVARTNHAWCLQQGTTTLFHFSVTDGSDVYHLIMNNDTQSWVLEGVQLSA